MSTLAIRRALEAALTNVVPALPTAYENVAFDPPADGSPYQRAFVLFAEPENPTVTGGHYRQRGFFQVTLSYPTNSGPRLAAQRAEILRNAYRRGLSFQAEGVTVIIERTPEISSGMIDGDRYSINVRARFYADLYAFAPPATPVTGGAMLWEAEQW